MGAMVDGEWRSDATLAETDPDGSWRRAESTVRNWITRDGAPGPTGEGGFPAAAGRYHLFAAWNCPWAHRALLTRALLGLEDAIDVSYALPRRTDQGWVFDAEGDFADRLFGAASLHEIYSRGAPGYTGRVTVPVIWDRESGRIVSNESADVIRMLNDAFGGRIDLCPAGLRPEIDRWNALIYPTLNNGVYRAGFASSQAAYETAAREVFATLDRIEAQLGRTRFLAGDSLTEADIRLFPTLARFDVAYHYAFKCNLRRLVDYPNLWPYAREIHQTPGVAGTVRFDIYKRGYHSPSPNRNPLGIVPIGPEVDWSEPHGRG